MTPPAYGLMAQFHGPPELLRAAAALRDAGYRRIEAYAPMPIEGLAQALGTPRHRLSLLAALGGLIGGSGVYGLQWYAAAVDYPLDVGGRTPLWPGLIPGTFEMTVLGAALCVFFGTLISSGLPRLIHPVFNEEAFAGAAVDGFFLCVEAADARFDGQRTRRELEQCRPLLIREVRL